MQLRPCNAWQAVRVVCLAIAILAVSPCPSAAQSQDADGPAPAPDPASEPDAGEAPPSETAPDAPTAPKAPIDASKHGTVEAEIPAKRESKAQVPDRAVLKDRLLEPRWDRGGFFLGLGGHYAMELTDQIGGMGSFASGGGVSLRVGLRHNRFWQTEFSGIYTSKFKDGGVDFWAWGVHLGERFYLTKTRLQPYIGAHVGFLQLRGTNYRGGEFGFVPKVNAGVAFYSRPTFSWDLDLSYFIGEIGAAKDSSFATATLGFTWF
jgi:hypothetical protein